MAVDDQDIVDLVAHDKGGDCLLVISDHLEWDEDNEHLFMLQEKINRYLNFIASGELYDKFPETHLFHINGDKLDDRIENLRLQGNYKVKVEITQELLKKFVWYDPETGIFTYKPIIKQNIKTRL